MNNCWVKISKLIGMSIRERMLSAALAEPPANPTVNPSMPSSRSPRELSFPFLIVSVPENERVPWIRNASPMRTPLTYATRNVS
jgi:hypothetical protein